MYYNLVINKEELIMNVLIIILVVLILLVLYFVLSYNGLVGLRQKADEAFSTMDVFLNKRFDLIPNLVETVKGYAKHEKETFDAITKARASVSGATSDTDKLKAEGELSGAISRLLAVVENYPELKANTNFLDLQAQLKDMEDEISGARRYYNGVVRMYNTKIQSIPTNIIASMFNFQAKPYFEVSDGNVRENVKVSF